MTKRQCLFILLVFCMLAFGCAPKPVITKEDRYGCKEPPPTIFTSAGIDVSFGSILFRELSLGNVNIKTDPEIISQATELTQHLIVRDYIRCLAMHRDHYDQEQIIYLDTMNSFLQTKPKPEEFIKWQEKNQIPNREEILKKRYGIQKQLDEVREHQKPRQFSIEQREQLLHKLKESPKGDLIIYSVLGDAESTRYASEFKNIFENSGWGVKGVNLSVYKEIPEGLMFVIHSKESAPSYTSFLWRTLKNVGIKIPAVINNSYPEGTLTLIVGIKPQ